MTVKEFAQHTHVFARDHHEPGTISPRHRQRLISSQQPRESSQVPVSTGGGRHPCSSHLRCDGRRRPSKRRQALGRAWRRRRRRSGCLSARISTQRQHGRPGGSTRAAGSRVRPHTATGCTRLVACADSISSGVTACSSPSVTDVTQHSRAAPRSRPLTTVGPLCVPPRRHLVSAVLGVTAGSRK
jgi:hypothetical protein